MPSCRWRDAYDRLSETNPFPEFTSRACPAPCRDACIVGINEAPIQIKGIERAIIDRAFEEGWVRPSAAKPTGRRVAIIGSGPAGLAAADALVRRGHAVTVYERSDRAGGLLTYGVPNMKLDKQVVQRRIDLLARAGVRFVLNAEVGVNVEAQELRAEHDAVLLAVGAQKARRPDLPGSGLRGVRFAMDFLNDATRDHLNGDRAAGLDVGGQDVVVIGGGDTGADCIGTALRQGCRSLVNITRRDPPPAERDGHHLWPGSPGTYTLDYAHTEGQECFGRDPRVFGVQPLAFVADPRCSDQLAGVRVRCLGTGEEKTLPAQTALLAIGFVGHDASPLVRALGLGDSGNPLAVNGHRTREPSLYVAGDCRRGASLIVWAIREGLGAAEAIHADLCRLDPHPVPGPVQAQPDGGRQR